SDGHGYCAARPYESTDYPGNQAPFSLPSASASTVRWFRKAEEASTIQGPLKALDSPGILHPNEFGHQAVKQRVLQMLYLPVPVPAAGGTDDDDQLSEATPIGRM